MAIYQFYLAAIPKKGVLEYFGKIPDKLEFNLEKRTSDFLNEEINDEFDYFEIIQHNCWSLARINPKEIIKEIDKKLNRANWGNENGSHNWKTETNDIDIDASIFANENGIQEFSFRADLRQPNLKFLSEMIKLSEKNKLLLFDRKGNLVEPEMENIMDLIKKSNALKFVQNPIKFLTDLGEGKIEIE